MTDQQLTQPSSSRVSRQAELTHFFLAYLVGKKKPSSNPVLSPAKIDEVSRETTEKVVACLGRRKTGRMFQVQVNVPFSACLAVPSS